MLGFKETSLSYKIAFGLAILSSSAAIGTAFVAGIGNRFFVAGVIIFSVSILSHALLGWILNITPDIGDAEYFFVSLFVGMALVAVIIPGWVSAGDSGFVVIRRKTSDRVVFGHSLMVPYLDEMRMKVSGKELRWEEQFTFEDSSGVEVNRESRFKANKDREWVRRLVEKHNGNKTKIIDEIKKMVTLKLDSL